MKLHFEPDLDYQHHAIEAVCDLFRGQETMRTEFTVAAPLFSPDAQGGAQTSLYDDAPGAVESDLGVGNRLTLLDDEILANLRDVQRRNGLPVSSSLSSGDFTVEMETGTGKTYVYLRTVFELNRRYGFTKFVVVVPSVAIKEGVVKSLEITASHFSALYAGVPCSYFAYDSAKLGQVRNFATSATIQIMVATVGSLMKTDLTLFHKPNEKIGDAKPVDLIRATRPILIVDEPQSVDGGLQGRGKQSLAEMEPLATLRYSATHFEKHHMVYRLNAVDAYERKLVKSIEVASGTVESAHNKPYVELRSVASKRGTITARVLLDVKKATGKVTREELTVQHGDDLELTTGREVYGDHRVGEIRVGKGAESLALSFPGGERTLTPGEIHGDVDRGSVARQMIRRTISEHLRKEDRLRPKGIKVLSLFFIDSVEKYRRYEGGAPTKGEYATIFEEEYARAARLPDFRHLFKGADFAHPAEAVHDGYFSIDRKGGWADTPDEDRGRGNQGDRDASEQAYKLIMRDKERLLSFSTPLKFIFSHSALREGWDNPNVFQICSLREMGTERQRRQTLGRGLRLCVDQTGQRVRGDDNVLTVVATEGYEAFAEGLQKEIEVDTGIRFGVVEAHLFASIELLKDGVPGIVGDEGSRDLHAHLVAAGYLDASGKVQDALRTALKDGTVALPPEVAEAAPAILAALRDAAGRLEIKNADERVDVPVRKGVLLGEEFRSLWERIRAKTTYRVEFDAERLIEDSAAALRDAPPVAAARLHWRKADLAIGRAGVGAKETETAMPVALDEGDVPLPDVLGELERRTALTRRSLATILVESRRLNDLRRNPQAFIETAATAILGCKRRALVSGVRYRLLGDGGYYAQELFESEELTGYMGNLADSTKSPYEKVVFDSGTEREFAEDCEKNPAVRVYAKLPGWFKVPTPLGSYNPDWAVLVRTDEGERLYFVVETKSSLLADDIRVTEEWRILCGRRHFEAVAGGAPENPARYEKATSLPELLASRL